MRRKEHSLYTTEETKIVIYIQNNLTIELPQMTTCRQLQTVRYNREAKAGHLLANFHVQTNKK
jgi:hypothetical protein